MSQSKARITVSRTASDDAGLRQIIVSLDGRVWTTLSNGQSDTREIRPGVHRLKADNTLFKKSIEFDAAPGEEIRYVVANTNGPGTWVLGMFGSPILYVRLKRE